MPDSYDFKAIEAKWQQRWRERDLFRTRTDRPGGKFYYLDMYPYPSGDLHMGHVRNYIIGDVYARYVVMQGKNVLHPMGWDAFGLPAENAAIQRGVHPGSWTRQCIQAMRRQIDRLGISYDWSREVTACDPEYYKWSQWLFLQLYHAGLAHRKRAPVNWCSGCNTSLANEQVVGGRCERCEALVEKRDLEQWFFATTKYAERLRADLDRLQQWPERVRVMQRNWIGRSEGVQFELEIEGSEQRMSVFTTRIDTVYGITYMVLAPEHPLAASLTAGTDREQQVRDFVREVTAVSEIERAAADVEKKGIFTGRWALHPLTGERVPIWIANYVLMEYGTGAIMAVPAHDQRDLEFARQYGLPVKVVIQPEGVELDAETMPQAHVEEGVQVDSGPFSGLPNTEASERIADYMEERGLGRRAVNYRLRDWCISRQRYWGAPIPMVYCDACGFVPVAEQDLPVVLPLDVEMRKDGQSPLKFDEEFLRTACPQCGGPGRRETDTMDTFVDSSWYFLRYTSPDAQDVPFRRQAADYWLPVDKYVGGIEHAIMHLFYARFITKVLYDQGHIGFDEPFTSLFTQGMLYKDGAKMSKSKGNVVPSDVICDEYGADTGRLFILFTGPPELDAEWSDQGVEGAHRFLGRVWRLLTGQAELWTPHWRQALGAAQVDAAAQALRRKTHQTIRKITTDIEQRMHFNTAISAAMELVNDLHAYAAARGNGAPDPAYSEAVENLLLMLSPFAPHIADELWERLGKAGSLYEATWPTFDPEVAREEQIEVVVQVNGKVRDRLTVPADLAEDELRKLALESERAQAHTAGKQIRKVIVIPNKLVNIVAN